MAALLNISRPTVYSWLTGQPETIRNIHKQRIEQLLTTFDSNIAPDHRHLVGNYLRKKLDPFVSRFLADISSGDFSEQTLQTLLNTLSFKISGMEKSKQLSAALENKRPLI